jgi:hypothetical protein
VARIIMVMYDFRSVQVDAPSLDQEPTSSTATAMNPTGEAHPPADTPLLLLGVSQATTGRAFLDLVSGLGVRRNTASSEKVVASALWEEG